MELSSAFVQYAHAGIDQVKKLYTDNPNRLWNRMGKNINDVQEYHRMGSISALPIATAIERGSSIPEVNLVRPFLRDYTARYYALKWGLEKVAFASDVTKTLATGQDALMKSLYDAMDAEAAGILNLATDTATTSLSLDGLPFASASHLRLSGTWSNILSANPVLTMAALEAAKIALLQQPDYNDGFMNFPDKFVLYVPPALSTVAARCVGAQGYMGTTVTGFAKAEGPNLMNSGNVRIVTSPFFTSTTAWMLMVDDPKYMNAGLLLRQAPEANAWTENNYAAFYHSVTAYFTAYRGDGRGMVYSSGTGS